MARPRVHADATSARAAANRAAAGRARDAGLVQRSVILHADDWARLRALRTAGETSDAATLRRLIRAAQPD